MRRKILHLSHTDIRYDARILKEMKALSATGQYEVCAVGIGNDEGAEKGDVIPGVDVVTLSLFCHFLRALPRKLRLAVAAPLLKGIEFTLRMVAIGMALSPQVVHCHDTFALPAGLILKRLKGCKLVYDAHELESDKNGQARWIGRVTLAFERFAWGSIDLLITVSPSILQWYAVNVGPKEGILVLNSPEGVELAGEVSPASTDGSYLRRTFELSDDDPIFIYVGLFMSGRGIEESIKAFSGAGVGAHLVFLGYGSLRPMIESAAKACPRIHYHPPVKHDKVVSIVRGADVGLCLIEKVSLSDCYCLPNKLFEYSFAGIAVLGSDLPDIRATIEKYELGAVTECSSAAIREAVSGFVKGRFRRGASCLTGLTWEAQAKRLVSAYDSL